jgi:ferredoxin-NADP reductase
MFTLTPLGLPTDADAYLCGPATFLADLTATLTGLGLEPSRIHTEIFGTAPGIPPGVVGSRASRPQPPPGTSAPDRP